MVHSPVIACELVGGLWRARGTGEGVPTPDSPKPQNLKMLKVGCGGEEGLQLFGGRNERTKAKR